MSTWIVSLFTHLVPAIAMMLTLIAGFLSERGWERVVNP